MRFTLIILSSIVLSASPAYVFASEGHEHHMSDGAMMHDDAMSEGQMDSTLVQAVEVGNTICPVSGNKVNDGKMGEAVKYEYNGRIYNLCCKMCVKDFQKDPEKYSKIAEDEVAGEKAAQSQKE